MKNCIVENSISLCDHLWFARASWPPYLRENGNLLMRENLVMTSPYVRPYVHTFFPLPPREFCPLLFQTEQVVSRFYIGRPSIWLLRGLWVISAKYPADWFRGEKLARKYLEKIISCTEKKISLLKYNAEKILHRCMSGKKFLTHQMFGKKVILQPQI